MAKGAGGKKVRIASPMLTKTGKTRLGPLSLEQLKTMLEKSSKPKDKAKINSRIRILEKILHVGKFKVVETFK
jgi:hypothetical protein